MEEIPEQENKDALQDSLTVGTPSSGGAVKVYFDASNFEEAKAKLTRGLAIITWLRSLGWNVGVPPVKASKA